MNTDKTAAVRLLQETGLETLPTLFLNRTDVASPETLTNLFGGQNLTIRTSSPGAMALNLPRVVDAEPSAAFEWLAGLESRYDLLIQPYAPLIASAEVSACADAVYLELVDGVWELDRADAPIKAMMRSRHPATELVKSPSLDLLTQHRRLMTSVCEFVRTHATSIEALPGKLPATPHAVGIKLHLYEEFGWSAVNVRLDVLDPCSESLTELPHSVIPELCLSIGDAVPMGTAEVRLDVSVARESAQLLVNFADELYAAGVITVFSRAGALSHFAIILREAGLKFVPI